MVSVSLDGYLLAESDNTIVVEGNHYFPPESVRKELLRESETSSVCPWKGEAHYYDAIVGDTKTVKDVAWYYPQTITDKAKSIEGFVAFYKNKVVTKA